MTREEAIKYFKRHLDLYCVDGISREAEEMAIKALEQAPMPTMVYPQVEGITPTVVKAEQEPSGDLISRQAAIEAFKPRGIAEDVWQECCEYKVLKSLPPVTAEPKTGHWILDETDNSITCDKCGCLIWANDISNGEAYYCPNCGARMEGVEE